MPERSSTVNLRRSSAFVAGASLVLAIITMGVGTASASSGGGAGTANPPFRLKVVGHLPNGTPQFSASSPTGLPPSAIQAVYNLSGLSPSSGAGAGQIIAIVDAFHDPNALSDLNTFNAQYG